MKTVPRVHWPAWIATGLLLAGTSGCAAVLNEAIGAAADPRPARPFSGTPSMSDFQRPAAVTSAYEVSHVKPWGEAAVGRPHSLMASLFDRTMLSAGGCQATPRGVLQVLGVPNGAPAEDLYEVGPFRIGLAGLPVPVNAVLSLDHDVVSERALVSGTLLAQQGPQCSHSLFLYVTFGGGGDKDAVVVNR